MKISLSAKVTLIVAASITAVGVIITLLFISAQNKALEREVEARALALAEALSRTIDADVAAENLDLMRHVQDIVHTDDVILTQVFSTLWLAIAAAPAGGLNTPPDDNAASFFRNAKGENVHFTVRASKWVDVYSPIHFDPHDKRIPKILIGYIRLRVQTSNDQWLAWKTILQSAAASFLLTLASVLVINFIVRKYVLRPVLKLHRAISGHVEGEFTDTVPVESADEIGELSAEFNRMRTAVGQWKERLADEKERLAVTLRSIGDGVIVTDASGIVVSLNTAAEHHTGWTTFEASGKHLTEVFKIINQNTRLSCENPVEQALRVNDVVGLANHTVLIRKDGSEVMIEDSAAPITDNKGATIGVVLVFRDVTSRIKAREELEKSEEKYRRIVDTAAEGIVSLDAKQAITFVNAKMSQLIGYQPDELIGKTFVSLMDPGEIDDQKKRVENRMKGYSETYERLFLKKNGAQVWTIVSATPMTDAEKKVTGSFAMVTDITARKKAEKTLETLNVELENRVRERTAEIEEKNRELKRLNKLFVNRELRMIELKERIRRLEGVPQDETPGP